MLLFVLAAFCIIYNNAIYYIANKKKATFLNLYGMIVNENKTFITVFNKIAKENAVRIFKL